MRGKPGVGVGALGSSVIGGSVVIAFAISSAPASALGSVCVSRVELRISALRRVSVLSWTQKRSITGARMAGPLPAEKTPERSGETPTSNQSLSSHDCMLRIVAEKAASEKKSVTDDCSKKLHLAFRMQSFRW